jgi:hypothetical protein
MCDDEDDLIQRKSAMSSSSSSSYSSNKHTSDNLFNNNHNQPTLDSSTLFDKKSSPNQGSSSRSFKLIRRSSFNDSSTSSLRSKNHFSPTTESHQTNSSPIHRSQSPFDTAHIPILNRPLFRPESNHLTRISSSSQSPKPLFNDRHKHSSSAYVYLRNPSSPMRVVS